MDDKQAINKLLGCCADMCDANEDFNKKVTDVMDMTYGEYLLKKIFDCITEYREAPKEMLTMKVSNMIKTVMEEMSP